MIECVNQNVNNDYAFIPFLAFNTADTSSVSIPLNCSTTEKNEVNWFVLKMLIENTSTFFYNSLGCIIKGFIVMSFI